MVGILTQIDSPRIPVLRESFLDEFIRKSKARVYLINYRNNSLEPNNFPIDPAINDLIHSNISYYIIQCMQMTKAFLQFCKYYIKLDIPWLLHIPDDSFINLKNFDAYMRYVFQLGDPLKEFILEGACIHDSNLFIHGGSGWIMSKYAVIKYIEYFSIEKNIQQCNKYRGDDLTFVRFLNNHKKPGTIGLRCFSSPYYQASGINPSSFNATAWRISLKTGTLDKILPICPNTFPNSPNSDFKDTGCIFKMSPITNVVFFHFTKTGEPKFKLFMMANEQYQLLRQINSTKFLIYFERGKLHSRYCYYNGSTVLPTLQELYP